MKIGRNDPCPCGSGEKYKKCCAAKDDAAKAAQVIQNAAQLAAEASTSGANTNAKSHRADAQTKPKAAPPPRSSAARKRAV